MREAEDGRLVRMRRGRKKTPCPDPESDIFQHWEICACVCEREGEMEKTRGRGRARGGGGERNGRQLLTEAEPLIFTST